LSRSQCGTCSRRSRSSCRGLQLGTRSSPQSVSCAFDDSPNELYISLEVHLCLGVLVGAI
jgi:hypothetical protein